MMFMLYFKLHIIIRFNCKRVLKSHYRATRSIKQTVERKNLNQRNATSSCQIREVDRSYTFLTVHDVILSTVYDRIYFNCILNVHLYVVMTYTVDQTDRVT